MKRKWQHPSEEEASRIHWRSLGELEGSSEFKGWLEREFPQGADELELDDASRRGFLKLMGASTALAGFGVACSRPLERLVVDQDGDVVLRQLDVELDPDRVVSSLPVELRRGEDRLVADTLDYSGVDRVARFQGRVRVRLQPRFEP